MARQHEKQAQDTAGNIPSLLLTNNDIMNPLFCLFETAGQMVNNNTRETKVETRVEIHGQGPNNQVTDKKYR